MNKMSKDEKGFTAVEGLLIVLILVVIGAVGYMVYHNDHKTKTATVSNAATKTTTTTTAANPYAGWQTYTLPVEKLSFMYPANWTINQADTGAPTSTQDQVTINAPDGSGFYVIDGVSTGNNPPEATTGSVPISYIGQSDYLVFTEAKDGPGYSSTAVGGAQLQTGTGQQSPIPTDRTAVGPNNTTGATDAKGILINCTLSPAPTLTQASSTADFKTCEQIVQSIKY